MDRWSLESGSGHNVDWVGVYKNVHVICLTLMIVPYQTILWTHAAVC